MTGSHITGCSHHSASDVWAFFYAEDSMASGTRAFPPDYYDDDRDIERCCETCRWHWADGPCHECDEDHVKWEAKE